MKFENEKQFEDALVNNLVQNYGWKHGILNQPTEQDLIDNWAKILYDTNCDKDRLNGCPLTSGEKRQLIERIHEARTPMHLNGLINGKHIIIKRDNPDDKDHFGKEVFLKIYDRQEIAGGSSHYQIARQPRFKTRSEILGARRGDIMLLINGMPVIHIELKRSGISPKEACAQIERYRNEGVFTGLFSLVQVFFAMNPEETLYFANPGPDADFDPDYFFHWANFNNVPVNDWQSIAERLLSIPKAHQLIGFYTIADRGNHKLIVMRSYQYYAATAISDRVTKLINDNSTTLGGYVYHTTGSGKTLTSFKSAQLIADSQEAEKVIFLIDRIELGTQSVEAYRNFSESDENVQETDSTEILRRKLLSPSVNDTLIVTSIQKMSRIKNEAKLSEADLATINAKRIVIIIDECHRSTFGDMLRDIKETFPKAILFGFTGTPIYDENAKKQCTTSMVFGDELHRYTIGDGLADQNVLGFDTYRVFTFNPDEMRQAVALKEAGATDLDEVLSDPAKEKVYYYFMDAAKVPMAGYKDKDGLFIKGIEDYIPSSQYDEIHRLKVVEDIKSKWQRLSRNKFHALLATSSIPEAIDYYRILKKEMPNLKVSALFDPSIDNNGGATYKGDGLVEIISDYNARYVKPYTVASYDAMKKDIALRLAHKKVYEGIENDPDKQLDLLVVVDQMLTGYDSKWLNTLYLDKVRSHESIIQAFSRTNRLFGEEKPFGTIRYYRKPFTMEQNIKAALKMYSGERSFDLFVNKLDANMAEMDQAFQRIVRIFTSAGIADFERLPDEIPARRQFVKELNMFKKYMEAALIQGFSWDNPTYETTNADGSIRKNTLSIDEQTFLKLIIRYQELSDDRLPSDPTGIPPEAPYDLNPTLIEYDTQRIDSDYMNMNFQKWVKALEQEEVSPETLEQIQNELHRSFSSLSRDEQKYANIFMHDVESGDVILQPDMTLRDYITQYQCTAKNEEIEALVAAIGVDRARLVDLMNAGVTETNYDEFGRFGILLETCDRKRARTYFQNKEDRSIPIPEANRMLFNLLKDFVLKGGYEI